MGNTFFYGPSGLVSTESKFTVVTQFVTADGTATGALSQIKRLYIQDGTVVQNSVSDIAGVSGNSVSDPFCRAQKTAFGDTDDFETKGGLSTMGDAFERGMVLVMSIW